MRARSSLLAVGLGFVLAVVLGSLGTLHAQTAATALAGRVTSAAEGPMEGVLVSARSPGSTITVTVVSDARGAYRFPQAALGPGRYALGIRAAGYDLQGPSTATIVAGKTSVADLRLVKTRDLADQLTDGEWLMSMPGSRDQKKDLLDCNSCHSLARIVHSKYTADQFQSIIFPQMLSYANNSSPAHPQLLHAGPAVPTPQQLAFSRPFAEYLASINLNGRTTWAYRLRTFPRPTGRATHVIITEYALPKSDMAPHDVVVDRRQIYFSDFHQQYIGQLDPETGAVTRYPTPLLKPGFPTGGLDLELDPATGDLWEAMMYQGGILRFDPQTHAVQAWPIPAEFQDNSTQQAFLTVPNPNDGGRMWVKESRRKTVYRFDPATGKFESFGPVKAIDGHLIGSYGIYADAQNDLYGLDFSGSPFNADRGEYIMRVDDKTGDLASFRTPTWLSKPRRGRFDAHGRLWFAEYQGNNIGMFDPQTERFAEWPLPNAYFFPYDVVADRTGDVWTGSMWTDRVVRLDPRTGAFVSYLLPRSTNIRRVFVDNSRTPPVLWVGSNHGGSIVRVQPTE